jgi:hypothetical protein
MTVMDGIRVSVAKWEDRRKEPHACTEVLSFESFRFLRQLLIS